MIEVNGYEFTIRKFSAYDSLKTLGKISKLLAPMIGSIDMKKVMEAKDNIEEGSGADLGFLSFLGDLDENLLMEVVEKLVERATHNGVPVSLNDTQWTDKTLTLVKLAVEVAKEEYSDFLLELGLMSQ